jgi:hypothetical protein
MCRILAGTVWITAGFLPDEGIRIAGFLPEANEE